jgi:hypothetical protein
MLTRTGLRLSWAGAIALAIAGEAAPATLTVTSDVNPAPAGLSVTFFIQPKVRVQGDTVTFAFGDGGTGTIEYSVGCSILGGCDSIQHAYAGPGVFTVNATGTIGGENVSGTLQITVTASTADQDIYLPTGAHLTGYNDVNWRTDLEVNNPGATRAAYVITLLVRNQANTSPAFSSTFFLDPGHCARYADLLYATFGFSGAAAVRITPVSGALVVTSRTYNQLPSGTYGQSVPAIPRGQAIGFDQDAYLIGLSHDPTLAAGYRTNLGFVNASPAGIHVEADFHLANGLTLGRQEYDLLPFEFHQFDKAFEQVTGSVVDDGYVVVRTTTAGAKFFAYAVVTDNVTGDPTYVSAAIAP